MKFELDEYQEIKLKAWQDKIKKKYGQYGQYDFIFTPSGVGTSIKVVSHLSKKEIDLTDIDKW